jgi:hypothetical protein
VILRQGSLKEFLVWQYDAAGMTNGHGRRVVDASITFAKKKEVGAKTAYRVGVGLLKK